MVGAASPPSNENASRPFARVAVSVRVATPLLVRAAGGSGRGTARDRHEASASVAAMRIQYVVIVLPMEIGWVALLSTDLWNDPDLLLRDRALVPTAIGQGRQRPST